MLVALISACTALAGAVVAPQQIEQRLLRAFVADVTRKTGVLVTTYPSLGAELVVAPKMDEVNATNLEDQLRKVCDKMNPQTRLIRLNLPKGLVWTAEELMAYAKAEAALFRRPVQDAKSDVIEILAQPLTKDQAKPAVDTLNLRPVYVIVMRVGNFGGVWETTYGQMRLEQRGNVVRGTYETNSGQIEGRITNGVLNLRWYEQANGSGGTASYQLSEDGMSFSGPWYNDSNPNNQAGTWTGRRLKEG